MPDLEPLFERAEPRSRWRLGLGAAVVLALAALAAAVLIGLMAPSGGELALTGTAAAGSQEGEGGLTLEDGELGLDGSGLEAPLLVHVAGAVRAPGVYELPAGARALDAVAAAGGFTSKADEASLNLARPLVDGEQLVVPKQGAGGSSASGGGGSGGGSSLIDLNSAGADQLDALPRIGPALASRIIAWRESNGRFGSVDDLLAVPGIGPATLEGLRGLVTAG